MHLIDTHAHLDCEDFDGERDQVIQRAAEKGVNKIVNIGADLQSSRKSVELAEKYDNIYAAVGVHPHEADTVSDDILNKIAELSQNKNTAAFGEIGLDFYYDNSPRDIQQDVFLKQLLLAKDLNLPVVIHSRSAEEETLKIMDKASPFPKGVIFHCYAYDESYVDSLIERDFYIAFGGLLTFRNTDAVREAFKKVPLNRILFETDAPYLTPTPFRGKRNEPAYVEYVLKKASVVRRIREMELAKITTENAERIYNI
ncbi:MULTISPECIES: TatD family hydrolase [unclassified Halanaerobium]|uniref:TatD family hydrolase n=1 Tax=unclassified Halanaerobium TaxID=2641197 RepID=UPI000DF1C330|nr:MULTISPECIES: TatD family hydrolase [unclassified Halanaerobium]RCW49941.1 TatD DNase family protein [Halanaerobium sp. MA284_MarDTE_T2]RCW81082.1 TatD DNase family protein [Halanaerobium sp. DL-01]